MAVATPPSPQELAATPRKVDRGRGDDGGAFARHRQLEMLTLLGGGLGLMAAVARAASHRD